MEKRPLIIAHRGTSRELPENTLPAVERALSLGVDGIEVDLQMTKDQKIVLFHDDTLGRTAPGGAKISDLTSSEMTQIRTFDGAKIPFLEELLALPRSCFLILELKCEKESAAKMAKVVARFTQAEKNLILASFEPQVLKALRHESSPHPLFAIADTLDELKAFGSVEGYMLSKELLKDPQARLLWGEKPLYCWTIDDPSIAKNCQADGIITNDPRTLQKTLFQK